MRKFEKEILCGLLRDVRHISMLAEEDPYSMRYDSIEREELRQATEESIVRTRLSHWLGFQAREKDWKAASRAYASLEQSGYIVRIRRWGAGLTHLKLLPRGRELAERLMEEGTVVPTTDRP